MKIITIQKSAKGGYCANVNGFVGTSTFAVDEISALKQLVKNLEEKNNSWIQKSDFEDVL